MKMRSTVHWCGIILTAISVPQVHGAQESTAPASSPSGTPAAAQTSTPPPLLMKLMTDDINVSGDGLSTETAHWEITPTNESAASRAAQQSVPFSVELDDVTVTEAYTLKSDGRKLLVDASQILDQLPQGSPNAPMFSDQRNKVIIYPDVTANDTVVLTVVRKAKQSVFPGRFFDSAIYSRALAWNDARETIVAPKSLPLTVETHDVNYERRVDGDKITYAWKYSAPNPMTQDIAAVGPYDREPRLFASSFANYDELGRAYAELATPKAALSEKVRSRADEIVGGEKDRHAQAVMIYEWVSRHIRYVGIELGRGRVVPHDAESILANAYGDCKDHAVLFAALLQAKGIQSEMVLINLGNLYTLPEPPTLAQLNHVITWIPEFKIYVDTTAGVAPFGTLPFFEYGKPVVHAVLSGHALRVIPVLPPGQAAVTLKTVSHLSAEGKLSGETTTTAMGPYAIPLRQLGKSIEATGSQRSAEMILQRQGLSGTGKFELSPSAELAPSYTISAHFDLEPRPQFTSGQGFPMPPGIRLLGFTGDHLMGPLFERKLPATEPTPCWSGSMVEELSLEPPPGKHFLKLPEDLKVDSDNILFTAHWSQSDRTVTVRREFTSKLDKALCAGALRNAMAVALPKIAASFPTQIALAED
jgi:transglutaminase-like putative cysteine protease